MTPLAIRWHGNGFIQMDLNTRTRMHFWSEQFPPTVTNATIHDHRFDFVSSVLKGTLVDSQYNARVHQKGNWRPWECVDGALAQQLDAKKCELVLINERHITAGENYNMLAGHIHATRAIGDTVTVMTKMRIDERINPTVYARGSEKPHDAFDKDATPPPRAMYDFVQEMLTGLRKL